VDEDASSTTAMVYEIAEVADIEIDLDMAMAIYTGIVYDTGRFSFSNTTARDLDISAKMVQLGVKPDQIVNDIFFENSFDALKTIGKGLYSLESHLNGLVNVVYLGIEDLKNNNQSEIEELANYSVAIKGGKIGLFIREIKPGFHKVSFRSKCHVDVNTVAKAFDGGGHSRAAGCRIDGTKEEILPKILNEISKQL
jgi:phosphoesterase RecJ-like protein